MRSEVDRAWAAGFYDGEGSASHIWGKVRADGTRALYVRIHLGQADKQRSDFDRFIRIMGVGTHYARLMNGKQFHDWSAQSKADVAVVRNLLWPYMGEYKREQWDAADAKAKASRTVATVVPDDPAPASGEST